MGAWRKRGNVDVIGRQLVQGMVERGIEKQYAEAIFAQILGFGEYGFPESHSASFALLVYVSGWLRCHYLAAFSAALINSQPMGFYSPRAILADFERHGGEVRPVCIAASDYDCSLEPGASGEAALRMGLRMIRGLGEEQGRRIVAERASGPYRSISDLARRTRLDKGALQALAEADAFASLGVDRRRAAWEIQGLWNDLPLFVGLSRQEPDPGLPREDPVEALHADLRAVGASVRAHPIELIREPLRRMGVHRLSELLTLPDGAHVRVAGLVQSRQRPGTASGVVFLTLEDETAMLNLIVWPRVWERYRRLARHAPALGADGRLQREGLSVSLLVESFWEPPGPSGAPPLATLPLRSRDFH